MSYELLNENEIKIMDLLTSNSNKVELPESIPVDFIKKNKLCYILYKQHKADFESKFNPDDLNSIWRKARNMEFTLSELGDLSKKLDENSIKYLYLFKAIESQCDSTDVDIVINDHDFGKVEKILRELGYFIPLFPYEDDHYVMSKNGNVAQMDIRTETNNLYKHYVFDKSKTKQLADRRTVNGFYVPSIEDDLITSITRTIDKKEMPLLTLAHISNLLEKCSDVDMVMSHLKKGWNTPFLYAIYLINDLNERLYGKEINSPLVPFAKKSFLNSTMFGPYFEKKLLNGKNPFESKAFYYYWSYQRLVNDLYGKDFKRIGRRFLSPFIKLTSILKLISYSRKKSLLISFSGIDGTGKSSNSSKMIQRFKDMRIPSGRALGLWTPKVSYPLMGTLYLAKGWRRKDYHKSAFLRKTWNYIVILDYIYIYLTRVWPSRLIGKTVFMDKYSYDLMAMLVHDQLYSQRASELLLRIIPQPDLTFIFDIPEEVSNERKDDTQEGLDKLKVEQDLMEYLKIKREAYLSIADSYSIPIVDSTRNFDEVHEELFQSVINMYVNKK